MFSIQKNSKIQLKISILHLSVIPIRYTEIGKKTNILEMGEYKK